ncbi:hypothetical protein, partial [Burkholderia pseudomallei]
ERGVIVGSIYASCKRFLKEFFTPPRKLGAARIGAPARHAKRAFARDTSPYLYGGGDDRYFAIAARATARI